MPAPPDQGFLEASHFSPDTLQFIRLLGVYGVRYVVVGGEAVIYHGCARFTGDVDFFYADSRENVAALFAALNEFWARNIPGIESADELAEPGVIVQFGRPPNRIDLLNRIDGVQFDEAWRTRLTVGIRSADGEVPILLMSRENLIRNKRASGRPKDLADLKYLEDLAGLS